MSCFIPNKNYTCKVTSMTKRTIFGIDNLRIRRQTHNGSYRSQNFVLIESQQSNKANFDTTNVGNKAESTVTQNKTYPLLFRLFQGFASYILGAIAYTPSRLLIKIVFAVKKLPLTTVRTTLHLKELFQTLLLSDTRSLWMLERKLTIKIHINKIVRFTNLLTRLSKQGYLLLIVLVSVGFLNFGAASAQSQEPTSFLSAFINNNSLSNVNSEFDTTGRTTFPFGAVNASASGIQKIVEHTVQEGETIPKLAELYGLDEQTLIFNNSESIKDNNVQPGKKIYIPWVDGYIYNTIQEVTPEEIGNQYKISNEIISKENIALLNPETRKFPKDRLILIPTKDLAAIDAINKETAENKRKEEEQERQKNLSNQAINRQKSYTSTSNVSVRKSSGFIWPTTGNISRCFSSYHPACDIANFSAPPIVAVQDAVVSDIYRFTVVGYGNAVVLDHGDGIKTLYAHMSEIYVSRGQQIKQGQLIGKMGQTGMATGIHLHFEVTLNGSKQDPLAYLP